MLEIRLIKEKDYQNIVDWNDGKDEAYLFQWAGPKVYQYPITLEQIQQKVSEINSQTFAVFEDGDMIGSVELNDMNDDELSANICRFILSDKLQNKGYGTIILKELVNYAFTTLARKRLTLRVYCYNTGAIRCYERCGFLVKEYNQQENTKWNSYTMELRKDS